MNKSNEPVLYGIVSFGVGCADSDYPGVYTKVANILDFVSDVINQSNEPTTISRSTAKNSTTTSRKIKETTAYKKKSTTAESTATKTRYEIKTNIKGVPDGIFCAHLGPILEVT